MVTRGSASNEAYDLIDQLFARFDLAYLVLNGEPSTSLERTKWARVLLFLCGEDWSKRNNLGILGLVEQDFGNWSEIGTNSRDPYTIYNVLATTRYFNRDTCIIDPRIIMFIINNERYGWVPYDEWGIPNGTYNASWVKDGQQDKRAEGLLWS